MFSKQWLLLAEHKGEERHKMAATERKPGDGKKLRLVIRGSTKALLFLLLGSLGNAGEPDKLRFRNFVGEKGRFTGIIYNYVIVKGFV